jgi:predicted Rossmann-fold nucleotide-binding protein
VALPGGLGTLEELAEITTWAQLGLHRKPIATLDVNLSLVSDVATVDDLLPALRAYTSPRVGKWLDPERT